MRLDELISGRHGKIERLKELAQKGEWVVAISGLKDVLLTRQGGAGPANQSTVAC